jgi:Rne/Rng family ribonuclease
MSTELIINASLPETRIALMESGEIQDLLIERASGKGITGNIYKGRVTRVLPGMQAAFVDIGLEKAAFLYVDDVFVHGEIFDEEEESAATGSAKALAEVTGGPIPNATPQGAATPQDSETASVESGEVPGELDEHRDHDFDDLTEGEDHEESDDESEDESEDGDENEEDDEDEDSDESEDDEESDEDGEEDDHGPVEMSAEGEDDDGAGRSDGGNSEPAQSHPGTVSPSSEGQSGEGSQQPGVIVNAGTGDEAGGPAGSAGERDAQGRPKRHRRGRRGGRFRNRRDRGGEEAAPGTGPVPVGASGPKIEPRSDQEMPENFVQQVSETGESSSDRAGLSEEAGFGGDSGNAAGGDVRRQPVDRQAFRSQRSKDRRVPSRSSRRPVRAQVNIQDLLKEGQEVLVQVAKDPIATKGARLTCHISLPGRHLVCMPTIDHVGVSRRIERDDERRKLRDIVERYRPRNLGFIVRTASGRGQAEKRIEQDIDYLTHLWDEIREKSASVTAPALVYEDLNSVLRAIRDWVTEDIDKIIVDSRYHYNDILRFVSHFMPSLKQKVELYHGDIPIFDAYNISTELSRALERKVWLKSGGYLVIDQAEALVAIDVNTGRFVGKKNLEDTILKTNLEAVQEIAYQLRLRNCGGIIILDLIDMEKEENKQRVYRALEEAIKRDRARPTIIKISELGLVEMTRKRTRDTIVRALCESCTHCEGKGFIKSKTTVAYEVLREIEREVIERDVTKILVQAHPDAIDILAIEERETLDQIERRYKKQIYLQAVTDFHPEQFEVAGDKKPGKQAGEFSEVVQSLKGASTQERGTDRERDSRNSRGGRDRGGQDRERNDRGGRGGRGGRDRDRGRGGRDRDQQGQGQGQGAIIQADTAMEGQAEAQQREQREPREPREPREQRDPVTQPQPRITGRIIPRSEMGEGYPALVQPGSSKRNIDQNQNSQGTQNAAPSYDPGNGPDGGGNGQGYSQSNGQSYGQEGQPGNIVSGIGAGENGGGGTDAAQGRMPDDDFFENEEDRLAFVRAQAAQDAALARLNSGSGNASPSHRGGMGGGQRNGPRGAAGGDRDGGRGGRGARGGRGRRGGKFSGGSGQGRDQRSFGPRGGQGGGPRGGGQGGPMGGGPTGNSGGPIGNGGSGGGNPGGDSGGGSSGSSGGGAPEGGGGGGDHSSPPSV